jgi:protein SDA1
VHALTPPDVLTPVVRKLAAEFVHPGVAPEVIAAGINAIREVCRRQPWCMEEELLGDLVEYRKSRDKGVITASRGILQLYREVNPGMLKRRERVGLSLSTNLALLTNNRFVKGKEASTTKKGTAPLPFGHTPDVAVNIEGLEVSIGTPSLNSH